MPVFVGGRRLGLAVLAALISLGAVGCSGGSDSPQSLPPISTTPAPSQSSAAPQSPKAAAVAVVREYFRLINNLEHDMNADAFIAITTPDCPCRAFARDIRKTAGKGQHFFGHIHVTNTTPAVDSPRQVEVLASYNSGHGGTADAEGHVLFRGPRRTGVTERFYVRLASGKWRVSQIDIVRKGRES